MRLILVVALSVLFCGFAPAATTHEATYEATYVVGNLGGIEAGAEGVFTVDSNKLVFRSGKTTIEVPYANLTVAQLGPTLTHSVDVPLYRVWQLHKRFLAEKPTFQNLTFTSTDAAGKEQSMTLELLEPAAREAYDIIQIRTGRKPKRPKEDWWGDSIWRTTRTNPDWDQRNADDVPVKQDVLK